MTLNFEPQPLPWKTKSVGIEEARTGTVFASIWTPRQPEKGWCATLSVKAGKRVLVGEWRNEPDPIALKGEVERTAAVYQALGRG